MLKRVTENNFLLNEEWETIKNIHIGSMNRITSDLIKKPNPNAAEEKIKNLYWPKFWNFLKNKYPKRTKNKPGTRFNDVLEYAHTVVEKARISVRIMEFVLENFCSIQMRKKIATDNEEKNGP